MNQIDVSWKKHSIEELDIPMKTIRFLELRGICNMYELLQQTQDDFMKMSIMTSSGIRRFLGRKELHILLEAMDDFQKLHSQPKTK